MPPEPLEPQPGSNLDPRNVVGRRCTIEDARKHLLAGNNLALKDSRRMGKTCWIERFAADPGEGLEVVVIDFEGVHTSTEFLLRAVGELRSYKSLPRRAATKLASLFENVEVSAGPLSVKPGVATRTPGELLSETIRSIDEHLEDGRLLVIAMDEVPIAIDNIAKSEGANAAHTLLQTLRNLRQRKSRLRWIVSGSVGFHHVLRRCGATEGVLNDLVNLPLGPLGPDEATDLARRLFLGIGREPADGAVAALCEESGRIPFLMHALALRLSQTTAGRISAQAVAMAFRQYLDDRDDSGAATHLLSRLPELYGDRSEEAERLLDHVALEGTVDSAQFKDAGSVLDYLIDDHYLIEVEGHVSWRYDVHKRIWAHRQRLTL